MLWEPGLSEKSRFCAYAEKCPSRTKPNGHPEDWPHYEREGPRRTAKPTESAVGSHHLLQTLLRSFIPIPAVQLQKDRGIREGDGRFHDENLKYASGLIEFCDDLIVRHSEYRCLIETRLQFFAKFRYSRRIRFRNEVEFNIHVDDRPNVLRRMDGRERRLHHVDVACAGNYGFHPVTRLQWVRSIRDYDPVSMAKGCHPLS